MSSIGCADAQGVLSYVVGVRSLDGAGAQARGVAAQAPATATVAGTGTAPGVFGDCQQHRRGSHSCAHRPYPRAQPAFDSDIYRVNVVVEGAGWEADVQNALVAVKAGESARVPVFARRSSGYRGLGESDRDGDVRERLVKEGDERDDREPVTATSLHF